MVDRVRRPADPSGRRAGDLVLVAGASGYVGGRLVPELLAAGYRVRCLVRTPAKIAAAPWRAEVEVVEGDAADAGAAAFEGVTAAYYLVHSIGASPGWIDHDRRVAAGFRDAATDAGVERLVYLGGLGDAEAGTLSPHLASRHEVGQVLADGPVPVIELRAAVVIGSGSASFEMLRYLVEVLPIMVTPRWVDTRCQPIAIRDVLAFLVGVLDLPATSQVFEIGGPEVLSYRQMMAQYALEAGLPRRLILPVPVLTPRLSSLWVGLVTPLPRSLARPLVDSLVNEVIVTDDTLAELLPSERLTYRQAVRLALGRVRSFDVATTWAGASRSIDQPGAGPGAAAPVATDPGWSGGTELADRRTRSVDAPAAAVFAAVTSLGGAQGWPAGRWLWQLRGLLDVLVGGPGLRRGRRHPSDLHVGDTVDFWRVEAIEASRRLVLRAEMRLPGQAWLEWSITPGVDPGTCTVAQTARFRPRGLAGRAYWLAVAPFHRFIFPTLLAGVAAIASGTGPAPRATRP